MSVTNNWIHCSWSTKNRYPYLRETFRYRLYEHIVLKAEENSIYIEAINGWTEHVHILLKLHATQSLASVMHLIKGEASNWINRQKLTDPEFDWQDGYHAESVSLKGLQKVKEYIRNQEKKHRGKI